MAKHRDDLEDLIAERAKRSPEFPRLIAAAERRQLIARKLAKNREAAKLSQTQVAAKMKTSASVVSRIEGGADVLLSTLQKYAAAIGMDLDLTLSKGARGRR